MPDTSYGLPSGSAINYKAFGFPLWVDDLCAQWHLSSSTYAGHQESDRPDIGAAPNPEHQNRGIDWAGDPDAMLRFAKWLVSIGPPRTPGQYGPPGLEMVVYEHALTGERVWYPSWVNYGADFSGHRDHVHTRQSAPLRVGEFHSKEPADTLFADVSEWQKPVDDSYPYRVLSIRANDGTYRDKNWTRNDAWCRKACDSGRLAFYICYFVWRQNWADAVVTLKSQVGTPHPKMVVMMDVESWGGQITGDQSAGLNAAHDMIATWLGDRRRVIGYGNIGDLNTLWPTRPDGIRLVIAAYGNNPDYPGKIAHQYTDGQGYGGGLPEGAPPFTRCDMNSADGLTATQFAAACGISASTPEEDFLMSLTPDEQRELLDKTRQIWGALFNPIPSKSRYANPEDRWPSKDFWWNDDGFWYDLITEHDATLGDEKALARVQKAAANGDIIAANFLAGLTDDSGRHRLTGGNS